MFSIPGTWFLTTFLCFSPNFKYEHAFLINSAVVHLYFFVKVLFTFEGIACGHQWRWQWQRGKHCTQRWQQMAGGSRWSNSCYWRDQLLLFCHHAQSHDFICSRFDPTNSWWCTALPPCRWADLQWNLHMSCRTVEACNGSLLSPSTSLLPHCTGLATGACGFVRCCFGGIEEESPVALIVLEFK